MHLSLLFLTATLAPADADDLHCLKPGPETGEPGTMLYRSLQAQAEEALGRRAAGLEKVTTPEEVRAYQRRQRELFLRLIGGLPERTPLNARVTGRLEGDGYRVEKVIYESQPGHHVTAVLYLPAGKPPYPGVIIPCGHSHDGKAAEAYQRVGILLAKNGIAGLCYDPIGQGERYQVFGAGARGVRNPAASPAGRKYLEEIPGQPEFNCVEEHTLVGIGSILLGVNTARYRIWDGIRSLDYLASRPDIDPRRLGCTGNSGGGTLTSYLMALDERILCAAPACYLTTFSRLLASNGPQDAEQNLFGQISLGLDEGDYVLMRAPRPTLLLAGTRDATFDIRGTWDIFREGKRFYARLDLPERVDMVESDAPHGFTVQLRVGAVRWMCRWLLNKDEAITEPDFPVWKDAQLQCTPDGQVMLLEGERSVFQINLDLEKKLAGERRRFWENTPRDQALARVREVVGVRPVGKLPAPRHRKVGEVRREGYRIDRLVLEPEGGIPLPALAFVPARPRRDAVLYLHGEGKHVDAAPGGPIEKLVAEGALVLAVDLPGVGETRSSRPRDWSRALFGPNGQESFLAYLLGRSLVGMRAEDILVSARFLADYEASGKPHPVRLVGIGTAGVPALHAMALEPGMFSSLQLRETLTSWSDVLHVLLPRDQLTSTVHGALRVYDLPDLIRTLEPGRVRVEDPRDATGRPPGPSTPR